MCFKVYKRKSGKEKMYFTFTPFRKKETKELSSVVLQRAAQIAKSKVICVETFGYLIIVLVFKFGATFILFYVFPIYFIGLYKCYC